MCDEITRKTRKLTKMIIINDMRDTSILSNDKKFLKCLGDSSKISEKLYPQLLDKNIFLNSSKVVKVLMNMASLFMSKKSLSKISVCKGDTLKDDLQKCPYALKNISLQSLPTFLGYFLFLFYFFIFFLFFIFYFLFFIFFFLFFVFLFLFLFFIFFFFFLFCFYYFHFFNLFFLLIGGSCDCEGGCVGNIPNDQKKYIERNTKSDNNIQKLKTNTKEENI